MDDTENKLIAMNRISELTRHRDKLLAVCKEAAELTLPQTTLNKLKAAIEDK